MKFNRNISGQAVHRKYGRWINSNITHDFTLNHRLLFFSYEIALFAGLGGVDLDPFLEKHSGFDLKKIIHNFFFKSLHKSQHNCMSTSS